MGLKVVFVANRVFEISTLPNAAAAFLLLNPRDLLLIAAQPQPAPRKGALDYRPTPSVIRVAVGQRPDRMQVIVQQNDRINPKRPPRALSL
jgi:hypothetical protein